MFAVPEEDAGTAGQTRWMFDSLHWSFIFCLFSKQSFTFKVVLSIFKVEEIKEMHI